MISLHESWPKLVEPVSTVLNDAAWHDKVSTKRAELRADDAKESPILASDSVSTLQRLQQMTPSSTAIQSSPRVCSCCWSSGPPATSPPPAGRLGSAAGRPTRPWPSAPGQPARAGRANPRARTPPLRGSLVRPGPRHRSHLFGLSLKRCEARRMRVTSST